MTRAYQADCRGICSAVSTTRRSTGGGARAGAAAASQDRCNGHTPPKKNQQHKQPPLPTAGSINKARPSHARARATFIHGVGPGQFGVDWDAALSASMPVSRHHAAVIPPMRFRASTDPKRRMIARSGCRALPRPRLGHKGRLHDASSIRCRDPASTPFSSAMSDLARPRNWWGSSNRSRPTRPCGAQHSLHLSDLRAISLGNIYASIAPLILLTVASIGGL